MVTSIIIIIKMQTCSDNDNCDNHGEYENDGHNGCVHGVCTMMHHACTMRAPCAICKPCVPTRTRTEDDYHDDDDGGQDDDDDDDDNGDNDDDDDDDDSHDNIFVACLPPAILIPTSLHKTILIPRRS